MRTIKTVAPGRPLRLAFARINQETNALSPVVTELSDFERVHLLEGPDLLAVCSPWRTEVQRIFKNAELSGFVKGVRRTARKRRIDVEMIPLLSAWAVPSGPLTRACFETLVSRLVEMLRAAGPIDGVYLALHGAMGVRDLPLPSEASPESEIVRRVREAVGDVPIAVSLDLHGNLTKDLVEGSDLLQGYRTNPHRDHASLGRGMAELLIKTTYAEVRPVRSWRSLPMLLGGGATLDFWTPMRSIFKRMRELEGEEGVLGATVMMVHPWNDHKELGWATLVVADEGSGEGRGIADRGAEDLAERCWAVRDQLPPKFRTPSEAIVQARGARLRRKLGVVVMADASDVVSAGAPGENTALVKAFLEEGRDLLAYVPIRDPALVEALWTRPMGEEVKVVIGQKLDPARGAPFSFSATIADRRTSHGVDRAVILSAGKLKVVVSEGPAMAIKPSFYSDLGLSIWRADVVVVKNFFPFLLYFLPYARKNVFVKTAGVTDFDAAFTLDFAGPMHPRDAVDDWREADHRRRGLSTAPA